MIYQREQQRAAGRVRRHRRRFLPRHISLINCKESAEEVKF